MSVAIYLVVVLAVSFLRMLAAWQVQWVQNSGSEIITAIMVAVVLWILAPDEQLFRRNSLPDPDSLPWFQVFLLLMYLLSHATICSLPNKNATNDIISFNTNSEVYWSDFLKGMTVE